MRSRWIRACTIVSHFGALGMTFRNWIAAWTAELGDLITSLDIGLRTSNRSRGEQSARAQPRRALDLAQLEDRVMLSASPAVFMGRSGWHRSSV